MTTREQLAILALLIVLAILAWFFWPGPTKSDVPVVAGVVPSSAFVAIGTAGPLASGQASSIPAVPQPRTPDGNGASDVVLAPANEARTTPSPSARAVPSVAPVRLRAAADRTVLASGSESVTGTASWFRSPRGVSAAGPALRTALGQGWRGTRVRVTGPAGATVTVLGDWMRADRLIDLDDDVFRAVCGPLSKGICRVEVTP